MRGQRARAIGIVSWGWLGVFGLASFVTACSSSDSSAGNPSFLLVELVPVEEGGQAPQAVMAEIIKESSKITRLCVNIEGTAGETTASFVLRRDPGLDPTQRVEITISAFASLSGQNNVAPGKEFACPVTFPALVATPQDILIDFCPSESRRIVFNVGTHCNCAGQDGGTEPCECAKGQTCSAGLSTVGSECGIGECCNNEIPSACALGPAP
jgi:hypothetical protein